ncbi:MAG: GNAT family N-acetyltransferase [Actinobacteria bacterium]|nr:GNAT family N-acetyltransferase [Actinomycetota bacterium]
MELRRAGAADADAVADVFLAARAGMTYLPRLHTDEETRRWIADVMLERLEVWVAGDGAVRGFAALGKHDLEHLYVEPSAQGQGIGAHLLAHAKARRPKGLELWVFQRNDGSRRFYERAGFVPVFTTDGADNEEREPDARYAWRPQ